MALVDDIRTLKERVLAELTAAHDYFESSKFGWNIVREVVKSGATFSIKNTATGTEITQAALAANAPRYVAEHLAQATFQQFVSVFENYILDLLRLWLAAYPRSMNKKQVEFEAILDAPDKAAITKLVVDRELIEVLYGRPSDWFAYLESRTGISCPPDEVERFTEAKASRDILVHNRGIANATYVQKAGKLARYKDGEAIDIPEQYHRQVWELLCKFVGDISDRMIAKAA